MNESVESKIVEADSISDTAVTVATANANPNDVYICVTMIVKNESRIIKRCLDSTLSFADCIAISDTGSTDNTVELIKEWQALNNIPGDVYHNVFQNFGFNRTMSLVNARKTLLNLGRNLDNSYSLLIDADMVLTAQVKQYPEQFDPVTGRFLRKSDLTKPYILLEQRAPGLSYYNMRLARQNIRWKCISKTHEFYTAVVPGTHYEQTQWDVYYIDDRYDGGCKADKYVRDERLLREQIAEEVPGTGLHVRGLFYLAQTLKDLGGNIKIEAEHCRYQIEQLQAELAKFDKQFEQSRKDIQSLLTKGQALQKSASSEDEKSDAVLFFDAAKQRQKGIDRIVQEQCKPISDKIADLEDEIHNKYTKSKEKWTESITLYAQRTSYHDFEEEIWYSLYMSATVKQELFYRELQEIEHDKKLVAKNAKPMYSKVALTEPKHMPWCRVLEAYLAAYQRRPSRSEPLQRLCDYYRNRKNESHLCNLFALTAVNLNYPSSDLLFIDSDTYNWRNAEHMAIAGFYGPGRIQLAGHIYCDRLSLRQCAPEHIRNQAVANLWHYLKQVPHRSIVSNPFTAIFTTLMAKERDDPESYLRIPTASANTAKLLKGCSWNMKNANLVTAADGSGYIMLVAAVNYIITPEGSYVSTGKFVYSRNFLVFLNNDCVTIDRWYEVQDVTGRDILSQGIQGLEDPRLIQSFDNSLYPTAAAPATAYADHDCKGKADAKQYLYFTASVFDCNMSNTPEICLCTMDYQGRVVRIVPLLKQGNDRLARAEKNWLPFIADASRYASLPADASADAVADSILILYDHHPITVIKTTLPGPHASVEASAAASATCVVEKVVEVPYDVTFQNFRGSAGPVPFENGYLYIIHQVTTYYGKRKYMHRFVKLNGDFVPVSYSQLFCFQNKHQIEYVAGMTWSTDMQSLLILMSAEDAASFLVDIPRSKIGKLLLSLASVTSNTDTVV